MLPGRSVLHHLEALTLAEQPAPHTATPVPESPLPFVWQGSAPHRLFAAWDIAERLAFGALPGIVTADEGDRADLLRTYTSVFEESYQ